MQGINLYPQDASAMQTFTKIVYTPVVEDPIVTMNDESARDLDIIWRSVDALANRWRGNHTVRIPGMPTDRREFWGVFAGAGEHEVLPVVQEFVNMQADHNKTAIDLGSGNSAATKLLLEKGWRVIAVDNSLPALAVLGEKNRNGLESGQLTIVHADATTFTPSESVDLVIAGDLFPYIDPSKFRATWSKIHDTFVKEDGFLIGTLLCVSANLNNIPVMNTMREQGAWFIPDSRMAKALLTKTGYSVQTCRWRRDSQNFDPLCIQFRAQKKTVVES